MKKKMLIISGVVIGLIGIMIGLYFYLLTPIGKNETVELIVHQGDSKTEIISNLKSSNLIRSKSAAIIYLVVTNQRNMQAGTYEFKRNMSTNEIISSLNAGKIKNAKKDEVSVALIEGVTLKKYIKLISDNTNIDYDDAIKTLNDKKFLKELINDYWFLTNDILDDDIYYALEGYLFPETYNFYKETTIEEVIRKILNETNKKFEPIKKELESSKYSVHEILTMASIVEKEANSNEDRATVSQVIYKRLGINMSLGMDVTSYYGVGKEMTEELTKLDLFDKNPYNTRVTTFIGLPVGPICNPSMSSINAVLNPSDTNYLYFVADILTGKVYFAEDKAGFDELKKLYIK